MIDTRIFCDRLLRDTSKEIRVGSALALGRINSAKAIPCLCSSLEQERDPEVQLQVIAVLTVINVSKEAKISKKRQESLCKKLFSHSSPEQIRIAAALALGTLKSKGAVDCLSKALEIDPSERVRQEILDILKLIEGQNKLSKLTRKARQIDSVLNFIVERSHSRPLEYDVFLCHNSNDKPNVIPISNELVLTYNLTTWFDKNNMPPGTRSLMVIIPVFKRIQRSGAIFLGKDGFGYWQIIEMYFLIAYFFQVGLAIVPVFLATATHSTPLVPPLERLRSVDFRPPTPDEFGTLANCLS